MNKIFIALLIVIVIGAVYAFFAAKIGEAPTIVPNTPSEAVETIETQYGFTYQYPKGADAYVVVTHEDAVSGDLVFSQSIFKTSEYVDFVNSTEGREGPVSLHIGVYRNPMNIEAEEWVRTHQSSNFAPNAALSAVTLGSVNYVAYQWDGLYRADAYAYAQEGYVYLFSSTWTDAESPMLDDMIAVIESVQFSTPIIPAQVAHGDIRVTSPEVGEAISSPLIIEGEARGKWFFEASFPVVLTNWDGLIIAEGIATAEGEWMTENFVPFKAELEFIKPEYGERGALILKKDNPSGLPEHDDAIEIPLTFE